MFQNPKTNANAVTIKVGASNGYPLKGASWQETLQPGDQMLCYLTAATAIGSAAKSIDLAGTGSQAFNMAVVMG